VFGNLGGADWADKIEVVPDQDDAEGGKLGQRMITNITDILIKH
jgi:hypothetical protein